MVDPDLKHADRSLIHVFGNGKGSLGPAYLPDTSKAARNFAHPSVTDKERQSKMSASPHHTEFDIARSDSRFNTGSYNGGLSAGQVQTPRSMMGAGMDTLLDYAGSMSASEFLGKRSNQHAGFDVDHLQHGLLYGDKRRSSELKIEHIPSPLQQAGIDSNGNSPANSPGSGGFKLHASRKNSELDELNPDLARPRPAED